jgi:hypothetical protein
MCPLVPIRRRWSNLSSHSIPSLIGEAEAKACANRTGELLLQGSSKKLSQIQQSAQICSAASVHSCSAQPFSCGADCPLSVSRNPLSVSRRCRAGKGPPERYSVRITLQPQRMILAAAMSVRRRALQVSRQPSIGRGPFNWTRLSRQNMPDSPVVKNCGGECLAHHDRAGMRADPSRSQSVVSRVFLIGHKRCADHDHNSIDALRRESAVLASAAGRRTRSHETQHVLELRG